MKIKIGKDTRGYTKHSFYMAPAIDAKLFVGRSGFDSVSLEASDGKTRFQLVLNETELTEAMNNIDIHRRKEIIAKVLK